MKASAIIRAIVLKHDPNAKVWVKRNKVENRRDVKFFAFKSDFKNNQIIDEVYAALKEAGYEATHRHIKRSVSTFEDVVRHKEARIVFDVCVVKNVNCVDTVEEA
jgi:hypothetical protein